VETIPQRGASENNFLRSWTNELYLWYREVPDLDPASYATADDFNLLKTSATTSSGNAKDRFHERSPRRDSEGRPRNGRETGRPERFRLVRSGSRCVLARDRTGQRWTLESATCSPSCLPHRGVSCPSEPYRLYCPV
jgi:hypothetical protein